jgi:nucleotide-binding universal stress UspA family protein
MFKKILLPLDLTEKHQAAIDIAVELAGQSKAEVTLLHVIEVISGLSLQEEKAFYGRLECSARAHLESFAAVLTGQGIACHKEVLFGNRAPEIARYAADSGARLIILTAPRIDPEHPAAGWGSMSYKVSILAPCPVLLVK